jgi:hypothetical protein
MKVFLLIGKERRPLGSGIFSIMTKRLTQLFVRVITKIIDNKNNVAF